MYTDRRIGQYTVATPRAAVVWSVAIHLVAFIGSACAWEDGTARPQREQKVTAAWIPEPPFLFWDRARSERGQQPTALEAVVNAITRFAPASAGKPQPAISLARGCAYPRWLPEVPIDPDPPALKKYDSVVIASAGALFFPGTEGLLSGDTVYTVYLRAGSSRDWILQFCPRDIAAPIDPPYPGKAAMPPVTLPLEVEYMVIHGIVNAQGRFEKLAIIGDQPLSPDPETFLRSLAEWEFQPATMNGGAVPVDVVLIVPNSGVIDTRPLP